eukprot:6213113-Pleurochrysis_carterae.AAC.3
MSASTAFAFAAAWLTRPGWWNARTVSNSQPELTSTPPSPTCSTMSASAHCIVAAAARRPPRSICRAPWKSVCRVERSTGVQRVGSVQPQTMLRAHRSISNCSMTSVGTGCTTTSSPAAHRRRAATAASARANHACTRPW